MHTIEQIFSKIARKNPKLSDLWKTYRVERAWDEALEGTIKEKNRPVKFSQGVLWIESPSSTWSNQLVFFKKQIINKLNNNIGQDIVRTIKLSVKNFEEDKNERKGC